MKKKLPTVRRVHCLIRHALSIESPVNWQPSTQPKKTNGDRMINPANQIQNRMDSSILFSSNETTNPIEQCVRKPEDCNEEPYNDFQCSASVHSVLYYEAVVLVNACQQNE